MEVKNISGARIGWQGLVFEPDEVKDVPEVQAQMMAGQPSRFVIVQPPSPADPLAGSNDRIQRDGRRR